MIKVLTCENWGSSLGGYMAGASGMQLCLVSGESLGHSNSYSIAIKNIPSASEILPLAGNTSFSSKSADIGAIHRLFEPQSSLRTASNYLFALPIYAMSCDQGGIVRNTCLQETPLPFFLFQQVNRQRTAAV
jgi:hypothetical protein